jgi:hypothetical protein
MSRLRYYSLRLEEHRLQFPKETGYNPNKFSEPGDVNAFDKESPIVRDEYNKNGDDKPPF